MQKKKEKNVATSNFTFPSLSCSNVSDPGPVTVWHLWSPLQPLSLMTSPPSLLLLQVHPTLVALSQGLPDAPVSPSAVIIAVDILKHISCHKIFKRTKQYLRSSNWWTFTCVLDGGHSWFFFFKLDWFTSQITVNWIVNWKQTEGVGCMWWTWGFTLAMTWSQLGPVPAPFMTIPIWDDGWNHGTLIHFHAN